MKVYFSFKGLLFATGEAVPTANHLIRLYVHESTRVYYDKLINAEDKKIYEQLLKESLRKNIPASFKSRIHVYCSIKSDV